MTVTGRTYTATRPRGLAEWRPHRKGREILDAVGSVLDEYAAYLPMTGRQLFYRLVALGVMDKTENAYDGLLEKLNRGRRAGLVPWDAIRDDGVTLHQGWGYDGPPSFWQRERIRAEMYELDRLTDQPVGLEVWVEAAGMLPQVARVADDYSVPVQSSGGFDSVTAKHTAARRFLQSERPTVVLHLGDLDPSGCSIIDSLAEDIDAFVHDYGRPGIVTWQRLAVTPEQILEHDMTTAPQKSTDKRGEEMAETVQAEAFSPDQLAEVVRAGIESHLDLAIHEAVMAQEADERRQILEHLDQLAEEEGR